MAILFLKLHQIPACDPCIDRGKRQESDGFSAEQIDLELSALLDTLAEESIPDAEKDHYQLISQTLRNHPQLRQYFC
jgi:hypothetical protein